VWSIGAQNSNIMVEAKKSRGGGRWLKILFFKPFHSKTPW
jgi:hypothetical protein